jgi:hypothetical protein
MNAISKFLTAVVYTVGFLAIVAMIGFIWLMLLGTSKNIRLRRDDRRLRSPWCRFPV